MCLFQAIKQHPSALQLYRERLLKEGTVTLEQVLSFPPLSTSSNGASTS